MFYAAHGVLNQLLKIHRTHVHAGSIPALGNTQRAILRVALCVSRVERRKVNKMTAMVPEAKPSGIVTIDSESSFTFYSRAHAYIYQRLRMKIYVN
jgi:hypothetical protein